MYVPLNPHVRNDISDALLSSVQVLVELTLLQPSTETGPPMREPADWGNGADTQYGDTNPYVINSPNFYIPYFVPNAPHSIEGPKRL